MTTPQPASNMINLLTLTFPELRMQPRDADKLRGYFLTAFGKDSILFHNHLPDGTFNYAYPLIQYKVLRGIPTVVGIGQGARDIMAHFSEIKEMNINGQLLKINSKLMDMASPEVGVISKLNSFSFQTPYFPFTQKNYAAFKTLSESEKKERLNTLIRNHLIQAMKGMGIDISSMPTLMVMADLNPRFVFFKNQRMQMYTGNFTANIDFPINVGIGKSTAKGFGSLFRR